MPANDRSPLSSPANLSVEAVLVFEIVPSPDASNKTACRTAGVIVGLSAYKLSLNKCVIWSEVDTANYPSSHHRYVDKGPFT
jgi:hypothetical protein